MPKNAIAMRCTTTQWNMRLNTKVMLVFCISNNQ